MTLCLEKLTTSVALQLQQKATKVAVTLQLQKLTATVALQL